MNEHQVENLLSQHGDEIMARRQPKAVKRRVAWKPILVTGTAVAATATFLLLPMNAEAAKIVKIKNAMKHVQSLETVGYVRYNGGIWREYFRSISTPTKSRLEDKRFRRFTHTIINDNDKSLQSYEGLPYACIYDGDSKALKQAEWDNSDPLKSALSILAGSPDPKDYSYSTLPGKQIDGKNTYVIDYRRADSKSTIKIVVDEHTNLPIESYGTSESRPGEFQETRTTFLYDQKYDPTLFSFDTSVNVIDITAEREKLKQKWSKAQVEAGRSPIYEASVAANESIWIAYGVNDSKILENIPAEVVVSGQTYLLAMSYITSWQQMNKDFLIHGKEVMIAEFVPLYDPIKTPKNASIRFGTQVQSDSVDFPLYQRVSVPAQSKPITVELERESLNCPSYMPLFRYDREPIHVPTKFWHVRAIGREAKGDLAGAAAAFEKEAESWNTYSEYMGYKPYAESARCHRLLKNFEKATKLQAKSDELHERRFQPSR